MSKNIPLFRVSSLMLTALLAGQLAGCSDSNDTMEPPAPAPAPVPVPVPEEPTPEGNGAAAEAAVLDIFSISCEKAIACPDPSDESPLPSVEACIAMIEDGLAEMDLAAAVDAGELEFDPALAETCIALLPAALDAQSCDEFLESEAPPVAACAEVLNGLFPDLAGGEEN